MADQVKSATRTLQVLDYFAEVRRPQALKEICEALRYPQSSMTVLLKTLTSMGYLNYDRSQRLYLPTIKVTSLGDWVPASLFGGGNVLEMMRDVTNATGETIVLAMRNDIYLEYAATIPSPNPLRFDVSVGSVRLIHQSPLGWLLMSAMPKREVEKLLDRSYAADKGAPLDMGTTMAEISTAAEQGYVYGENTPFLGGSTLGVMMPDTIGMRPLVLGLGGVLERMRDGKADYLASMQSILAARGA